MKKNRKMKPHHTRFRHTLFSVEKGGEKKKEGVARGGHWKPVWGVGRTCKSLALLKKRVPHT